MREGTKSYPKATANISFPHLSSQSCERGYCKHFLTSNQEILSTIHPLKKREGTESYPEATANISFPHLSSQSCDRKHFLTSNQEVLSMIHPLKKREGTESYPLTFPFLTSQASPVKEATVNISPLQTRKSCQ